MTEVSRCGWVGNKTLLCEYHDTEWGVPLHDDRKLFEFLILDTFQAGLSWLTILSKRENFRKAFNEFDAEKMANYNSSKITELMNNAGIVRNKLKIEAAISNAKLYLNVVQKYGSFDNYLWQFVDGKTVVNKWDTWLKAPNTSPISDAMSNDLLEKGFRYVGSICCYAFMQAIGMVNDHSVDCFRYHQVMEMK